MPHYEQLQKAAGNWQSAVVVGSKIRRGRRSEVRRFLISNFEMWALCPVLYAHSLFFDSLNLCPYAAQFFLQPLIASV